jgi:hypothetical protein
MKTVMFLLAGAGALALAPAMAAPHGGGPASHSSMSTVSATPHGSMSSAPAISHSPTGNGGGYNHANAPQHATGQPMQSCETTGSPPGHSATAPGSAFNPNGHAGTQYAGEKPQNQRNTASVSEYDVACANQPH